MIDVRLFRATTFNVSLATNVLALFVAVGYFLFIAQYLQLVLGLSPLLAGLWSLPSSAGFIIGSNLAPRLVYRFRPAIVLSISLGLGALALGLLTQVGGSTSLALVVTASIIVSLALSPAFTVTIELIAGSAAPGRAGAVSGISETGAELGGALGIAILGSIGTAVYRTELARNLPVSVPSAAGQIARDTLGAAVVVASQLPDPSGTIVLNAARDAFVQGLHVAAANAAAVAIATAVMSVLLPRRVPAREEPEVSPTLVTASAGSVNCCGVAE